MVLENKETSNKKKKKENCPNTRYKIKTSEISLHLGYFKQKRNYKNIMPESNYQKEGWEHAQIQRMCGQNLGGYS